MEDSFWGKGSTSQNHMMFKQEMWDNFQVAVEIDILKQKVEIIIITDLYSAFMSEDTEALDAAQED